MPTSQENHERDATIDEAICRWRDGDEDAFNLAWDLLPRDGYIASAVSRGIEESEALTMYHKAVIRTLNSWVAGRGKSFRNWLNWNWRSVMYSQNLKYKNNKHEMVSLDELVPDSDTERHELTDSLTPSPRDFAEVAEETEIIRRRVKDALENTPTFAQTQIRVLQILVADPFQEPVAVAKKLHISRQAVHRALQDISTRERKRNWRPADADL